MLLPKRKEREREPETRWRRLPSEGTPHRAEAERGHSAALRTQITAVGYAFRGYRGRRVTSFGLRRPHRALTAGSGEASFGVSGGTQCPRAPSGSCNF